MAYYIRQTTDEDLIAKVQEPFADIMKPLKKEDRIWWIVWEYGHLTPIKPVGFAAMRVCGEVAWFSVCGVHEKHQGRGLQKRLISTRLKYARKHGVKLVYTYTVLDNHASARSLIKRGFVPCTPPEEHYGKYAGVRDINYWKHTL